MRLVPIRKHRYAFPRWSVGTRRHPAAGFTLLEMVLVLFLMALVTSAGLMLTEGVEDQAKSDETKRRMEMIRKAIVGDPTRTVNGSPEISGFVADMGRLPGCIRELLERMDCENIPNDLPVWQNDENTGIWAGWRGPYIAVLPDRDGVRRFRDGYGNVDIDEDEDAQNYGWVWRLYQNDGSQTGDVSQAVSIRMQSYGFNGTDKYPNGDMDEINKLIDENDWKINISTGIDTSFLKPNTSSSKSICMKIFVRKPAVMPIESSIVTINEDGTFQAFSFSGFTDSDGDPVTSLELGFNTVGIYEHDGTECTNTLYPSGHALIGVAFLPRMQVGIVHW